jgi:hypothetical protein
LGGKLLIQGVDTSNEWGLWVTDGTSAGTVELMAGATLPPDLTVLGNKALFEGSESLWVTDGTSAGTKELTVVGASSNGLFRDVSAPDITVLGNKAIFEGKDASDHLNLWTTNGTAAGTSELTIAGASTFGLLSDADESPPDPYFTVLGAKALFAGADRTNHNGLWVTDGTAAGTTELAGGDLFQFTINPDFTVLGSKMLFMGTERTATAFNENLWVTDGTAAGTSQLMVADAYSLGLLAGDDTPDTHFITLGTKALFTGENASGHEGLWVSDGTTAGTSELTIAGMGFNEDPDFTVIGNKVLFDSTDASGHPNLWVTDGTVAGTSELTVVGAYSRGLTPSDITAFLPPPAAPLGLALASGSDSGVKGDHVTNVGKPVITGKGVAGDTVTLRDSGKAIGSAVVATGGAWSVTVASALAAGVHSLTATQSGGGGTSAASAALKLTIKTAAPAPSGLSFAVAADKAAKGDTVTVAGRGEAGDAVTLYDGSTVIGSVKVAAGGTWSLTTANPLAAGAHDLSAKEVDAAGNISPASAALNLTVASATPNALVFAAAPGPVVLVGGAGNDAFYAAGNTTMTGKAGANRFAFSAAGNNTITDFAASKANQIVLDASTFSLGQNNAGSTPQALPKSLFVSNSTGAFTAATQRFAYDTANGQLFYSPAGTTATEKLVATLTGKPALTAANLFFENGAAFHFPKTATHDSNGDGQSDIIWQNNNGQAAVWLMNGTTPTTEALAGGNPGPSWHVVGSGDFNADGKSDMLWQNTDGQAAIWLMNGAKPTSEPLVGNNPGPSWYAIDTGDFNGDGKSDILWQNTDGQAAVWLMKAPSRQPRLWSATIQGRAGMWSGRATLTATASPTSCGRTATGKRRSG